MCNNECLQLEHLSSSMPREYSESVVCIFLWEFNKKKLQKFFSRPGKFEKTECTHRWSLTRNRTAETHESYADSGSYDRLRCGSDCVPYCCTRWLLYIEPVKEFAPNNIQRSSFNCALRQSERYKKTSKIRERWSDAEREKREREEKTRMERGNGC